MKKMKLSEKQKEVIRLMREGKLIRNWYGGTTDILTLGNENIRVRTFDFLNDNKLIQKSGKPTRGASYYELTELGKTIDL